MENYPEEITQTLEEHDYTLLDPVGSGGFASVYTVIKKKYDQQFCVKIMQLNNEKPNSFPKSFKAEIDSLINIIHPNVVSIFDYFQSEHILYIILEYCPNGSLDALIKENGPLEPNKLYSMVKQLTAALQLVHSLGIAHRDIKPQNILLDSRNRVKLADFGLSQVVTNKDELIERFSGSLPFKSPEILYMKPNDPFIADAWAYGITIYAMATGKLPWKATTLKEWKVMTTGVPVQLPSRFNHQFSMVVKKLLEPDPSQRATLADVANCPCIANAENPYVVSNRLTQSKSILPIPQLSKNSSNKLTRHLMPSRSCVFSRKRRCSKLDDLVKNTLQDSC